MEAPPLRIVFMGTPAFAVPSLHALLGLDAVAGRPARVVAVVTQPDRPAGRGGRIQPSPVKAAALDAGIPILQPERLRRPESVAELRSFAPDLVVVAAFAQILSRDVLDLPIHGCLNVHASLLPRWRGASPIVAAILAGDTTSGITIMHMDAGLDTGPILSQAREPILDDDTTPSLSARLATLGARLLAKTIAPWVQGETVPRAQDDSQATLTRILRREDGRVDWAQLDATTVTRTIRAYDPWPGAYTTLGGRLLKILAAQALDADLDSAPGRILARAEAAALLATHGLPWPQMLVSCRAGVLLVRRVQPEGKRPMDAADFMRGQRDLGGASVA